MSMILVTMLNGQKRLVPETNIRYIIPRPEGGCLITTKCGTDDDPYTMAILEDILEVHERSHR